jgi:hypothetical protein
VGGEQVIQAAAGLLGPAEDEGLGQDGAGQAAVAADEADVAGEAVGGGGEEVLQGGGQGHKMNRQGGTPFRGWGRC